MSSESENTITKSSYPKTKQLPYSIGGATRSWSVRGITGSKLACSLCSLFTFVPRLSTRSLSIGSALSHAVSNAVSCLRRAIRPPLRPGSNEITVIGETSVTVVESISAYGTFRALSWNGSKRTIRDTLLRRPVFVGVNEPNAEGFRT